MPILPLLRYERRPGVGLAVRKCILIRRGLLASDVQRKSTGSMSAATHAEVYRLLSRGALRDPRAALARR